MRPSTDPTPEALIQAAERFYAIRPLTGRHFKHATKKHLVKKIAERNAISARTLYCWTEIWRRNGILGLIPKRRSDQGKPRIHNSQTALQYMSTVANSSKLASLSTSDVYRAYESERAWREERAGKPLGEFERHKYARWVVEGNILSPESQLPRVSVETVRLWLKRIRLQSASRRGNGELARAG